LQDLNSRDKTGLDTAIEALKLYREKKYFKVDDLMKFGRVCRVEKVMRPYLEALLWQRESTVAR